MLAEFLTSFEAKLFDQPHPSLRSPIATLVEKKISVVGLIFIENDEAHPHLILTRRSAALNSHPHQIALPGGFVEKTDLSLADAMRRELQEELLLSAVESQSLYIHGYLPLQRSLSGYAVQPILGALNRAPDEKRFNMDEVSELFFIDEKYFRRECRKKFRFNIFGTWRESSLYETPNCKVWGLTARIIDTLVDSRMSSTSLY